MNETVSRPSALHASRNQTASSAARVVANCSTTPSCYLAVYAQPPCTFTSPGFCSADPPVVITNAAAADKHKATAPFELMHPALSGCYVSLSPSAITQTVVQKRALPAQFPRPTQEKHDLAEAGFVQKSIEL